MGDNKATKPLSFLRYGTKCVAEFDIAIAGLSHFNVDQSGGLSLLVSADVSVVDQARQFDLALDRGDGNLSYFRLYCTDYYINWLVIEGDAEIALGTWALFIPGHPSGHISYRVDRPETESWIVTIDAAAAAKDLDDRVASSAMGSPGSGYKVNFPRPIIGSRINRGADNHAK